MFPVVFYISSAQKVVFSLLFERCSRFHISYVVLKECIGKNTIKSRARVLPNRAFFRNQILCGHAITDLFKMAFGVFAPGSEAFSTPARSA